MMLSVLIPSANEKNIQAVIAEVEKLPIEKEVIIASDRYRRGKGWAMREAFKQSRGKLVLFLDGDMDIKPRMIMRLLPFIEDYDIIVGSKKIAHAPFPRKMLTILSRIYITAVFGMAFDTQTGIKLFRRNAVRLWDCNDFAFDLEILYRAMRDKRTVIQVPIEATVTAPMSMKAVWKTLWSSVKIRLAS